MLIHAVGVMALAKLWWSEEHPWTEESLSSVTEVPRLLQRLSLSMTEHGYPPPTCVEMRLAVEEAIVNGIRHGNGSDPGKRVWVRYHVRPEEVLVEVEDEGAGFDPLSVIEHAGSECRDPRTGCGLLLMSQLTTWLCYDACANRLTLCKRHPYQDASAWSQV
jgi:serine/threonine-protein kinase RsbW